MNYKIIEDEDKLKQFIDWLPDLKESETYYLTLIARKKYIPQGFVGFSSQQQSLSRFTSNKENLFNKIKKLEVELGCYFVKDTPVPQESLALYITINPRCFEKATKKFIVDAINLVTNKYNGYNPHQKMLSAITTSRSRVVFAEFDFDVEKHLLDEIKQKVDEKIDKGCQTWIETRGGFHLLVNIKEVKKQNNKQWWKDVSSIRSLYSSDEQTNNDMMLPVIGTHQGGFVPKFL